MVGQWLEYLKKLVYPQMCMLCSEETVSNHNVDFCLECKINMPYTDHFINKENISWKRLQDKVSCEYAASLLDFYPHSYVKHMIHALKYENRKDIGIKLGKMVGSRAVKTPYYKDIDYIVPIPLHKSKRRKRGYNQARQIAIGITEFLDVPIRQDLVIKIANTDSQTTKNKQERRANVLNSFELGRQDFQNKHILIVDDVLTTGATIEACAHRLLEIPGVKISVITACVARG